MTSIASRIAASQHRSNTVALKIAWCHRVFIPTAFLTGFSAVCLPKPVIIVVYVCTSPDKTTPEIISETPQ